MGERFFVCVMEVMKMVITVLEAQVAAGQADLLQSSYEQAVKHLDAGIVQTYLLHGVQDAERWQIVTVWENRAVLDAMRQSGEVPRGVQIFRAAGAEPVLSMFDVTSQAAA
jgi:heme-degrading monooxygenase HmoA